MKKVFNLKITKKIETPDLPLFYYGESSVGVDNKTWTDEMSRSFTWDAAIETVTSIRPEALDSLIRFSESARTIKARTGLNSAELSSFGLHVTNGTHFKRVRFWTFISYLGNGIVPKGCDIKLVTAKRKYSTFPKSNRINNATRNISLIAGIMIAEGSNRDGYHRAIYESGKEANAHLSHEEPGLSAIDSKEYFYKTLSDWSRQD